ncbi:MAG: hypothetical protein K8R87_08835 [Verrucomicrobia bacterium]|nr:hypothetical protein [Verrucomicrobiota bacterium]
MSSHSITLDDLPRDGERLDLAKVSKLNGALLVAGIAGLAVSVLYLFGFLGAQKQAEFAYSWLFSFFFFFTLTNGGIFWTMLQHVSNSGWSIAVRRFFENLGANVKWMAFFALPFILIPGVKNALWEWMVELQKAGGYDGLVTAAKTEHHLSTLVAKYGYLNVPFWTLRAIFYFGFLVGIIGLLRKWSIQQDGDGDFKHTFRSRALCAFPMLIYALAVTFSAVDWVMALDYTWFSTMWGVYIFAGGAWSSMALSIIALSYVRSQGYLKKTVTMEHYHIMGKFQLVFTIFWGYIAFSQFFLIWYANITEETRFYLLRNTEGWWYLSNALVWFHFVATFVILLSAGRKKTPNVMNWVCGWILLNHLVDIYWLIIPERAPSLTSGSIGAALGYHGDVMLWLPGAWMGDVAAFVGIGGICAWAYLRRLAKASLYPCKDPRLLESISCTN